MLLGAKDLIAQALFIELFAASVSQLEGKEYLDVDCLLLKLPSLYIRFQLVE